MKRAREPQKAKSLGHITSYSDSNEQICNSCFSFFLQMFFANCFKSYMQISHSLEQTSVFAFQSKAVLYLYNCTTVTPADTQKRSLIIIPKDESAYEHQRQRGKQSLNPLNKREGLKNGRLLKSFFSPRHESIVPRLQDVSILSGHLYSRAVQKIGLTDKRSGCSARAS